LAKREDVLRKLREARGDLTTQELATFSRQAAANPVIQVAVGTLERFFVEEWKNAHSSDTREEIWHMIKALHMIASRINGMIADAVIELQREEKNG